MTFPLHFVRLASNATPRSSFSAGLYSVLHRLRDHPHFEIIPPTPALPLSGGRESWEFGHGQARPVPHGHAGGADRRRPRRRHRAGGADRRFSGDPPTRKHAQHLDRDQRTVPGQPGRGTGTHRCERRDLRPAASRPGSRRVHRGRVQLRHRSGRPALEHPRGTAHPFRLGAGNCRSICGLPPHPSGSDPPDRLSEKPGMRIDIGGIGKGFAAEKAAAVMRENGATGGLVAVAGDFRVFGRRADGTAWPLGIQHPREPGKVLAMLDVTDEAISTSGDYERYFLKDGVRYHHILDPRTLQPARLCQSVTIIAPDATTADALATGVFVMGPARGMALVERLGLGAVIVNAQGMVIVSSRLPDPWTLPP